MNPVTMLRYLVRFVNPLSLLEALASLGGAIKTRDWRAGLDPLLRVVIPAALVAFMVKDCGAGTDAVPPAERCGQDALIPAPPSSPEMFEVALWNLRMIRPPALPVVVVIGDPGPGYAGKSEQTEDGGVLITIDATLDDFVRRTVLIHEWAHALTWGLDDGDHGPHWGVAYADSYRAGAMGSR